MTKRILRAAGFAALLVLLAPAHAPAAKLPQTFDYTVVSVERRYLWTDKDRGFPQKCESWTNGRGLISVEVGSYGGSFELYAGSGGALTGGAMDQARGHVERQLEYESHAIPLVQPCWPCGPSSEFGPCREPVGDDVVEQRCGPKPASVGTALVADRRTFLFVVGYDQDALDDCPEVDPDSAWTGPDRPEDARMRLRGGTRRLTRMRVRDRATIVFRDRRGSCSKLRRVGSHHCSTTTAKVIFRRTS